MIFLPVRLLRGLARAGHRRPPVAIDTEGRSFASDTSPVAPFFRSSGPRRRAPACLARMAVTAVGGWAREQSTPEIGVRLSTTHEMTRTRTLERGVEEWSCTECSRRLLLRRPPAFEKVVLDRGDESAAHVGGTGGLQMAAPKVALAKRDLPASDRSWLAAQGIDWEPEDAP